MPTSCSTQVAEREVLLYVMQLSQWSTIVVCFLYGAFFILAVITLRTLLRKEAPRNLGQRFLLATVCVFMISETIMLVFSIIISFKNLAWAITSTTVLKSGTSTSLSWPDHVATLVMGWFFSRTIIVLNDFIVVWRAWVVVWRAWVVADHILFRAILVVCMIGTAVGVVVEGVFSLRDGLNPEPQVHYRVNYNVLIINVPLLVTTLISTLIILRQTWVYRREIKIHFQFRQRRSQVERILILLIESGFSYLGLLCSIHSHHISHFRLVVFQLLQLMR